MPAFGTSRTFGFICDDYYSIGMLIYTFVRLYSCTFVVVALPAKNHESFFCEHAHVSAAYMCACVYMCLYVCDVHCSCNATHNNCSECIYSITKSLNRAHEKTTIFFLQGVTLNVTPNRLWKCTELQYKHMKTDTIKLERKRRIRRRTIRFRRRWSHSEEQKCILLEWTSYARTFRANLPHSMLNSEFTSARIISVHPYFTLSASIWKHKVKFSSTKSCVFFCFSTECKLIARLSNSV